MICNQHSQLELPRQGKIGVPLLLAALSTLGACVPSPHSVTRNPTIDGRVRLTIRDSGCGLSEADPARLFDAFYSTKPDGMGMGLSLCKSIADAHNMHLSFAPNDGQPGMTFFVALPPAAARMP